MFQQKLAATIHSHMFFPVKRPWHGLMMCQADVAHENGKLGRGQID